MQTQSEIGPRVSVAQAARRAGTTSDHWLVTWDLRNLGQHPLQLLAARLPHSRFRSEERDLAPPPYLLPGERARLEFPVACGGPPGTVVENAFLILRVLWREEPWRTFARLRVIFDEYGGPQATTEVVTVQRVGFSEALKSVCPEIGLHFAQNELSTSPAVLQNALEPGVLHHRDFLSVAP